jgi:hypothetical protein
MIAVSGFFSCASLSCEFVAQLGRLRSIISHSGRSSRRFSWNSPCHAVPDESLMVARAGFFCGTSLARERVALGIGWKLGCGYRSSHADCQQACESESNTAHERSPIYGAKEVLLCLQK